MLHLVECGVEEYMVMAAMHAVVPSDSRRQPKYAGLIIRACRLAGASSLKCGQKQVVGGCRCHGTYNGL